MSRDILLGGLKPGGFLVDIRGKIIQPTNLNIGLYKKMKIQSIKRIKGRGIVLEINPGKIHPRYLKAGIYIHQGDNSWKVRAIDGNLSSARLGFVLGETDDVPKFGDIEL